MQLDISDPVGCSYMSAEDVKKKVPLKVRQTRRLLEELQRLGEGRPLQCYEAGVILEKREGRQPLRKKVDNKNDPALAQALEPSGTPSPSSGRKPLLPGAPVRPVTPGTPPSPSAPSSPVAPASPLAPIAPVAPAEVVPVDAPAPKVVRAKTVRKKIIQAQAKLPGVELKKRETVEQRQKRKEAKRVQRERLRVPPPANIPTQPKGPPQTVPEAVAQYTDNSPVSKELEVCIGVDSSGSMGDDVDFVKQKLPQLKEGWRKKYAGKMKFHLIEFSQNSTARAELRYPIRSGGTENLRDYLANFAVSGGVEPVFDAIKGCADLLSDPAQDDPKTIVERVVLIISDEPGDSLPGSPTLDQAKSAVIAKKAFFEWIDPDHIGTHQEPPYIPRIRAGGLADGFALHEDKDGMAMLSQRTGDPLNPWKATNLGVRAVGKEITLSPDGKTAVIVDLNGTVEVLDTTKQGNVPTPLTTAANSGIGTVRFSGDSSQLFIQNPRGLLVRFPRERGADGSYSKKGIIATKDVKSFDIASDGKTYIVRRTDDRFIIGTRGVQHDMGIELPAPNAKLADVSRTDAQLRIAGDGRSAAYSAGDRAWVWFKDDNGVWDIAELPVSGEFRLFDLADGGKAVIGTDDGGTIVFTREKNAEGQVEWQDRVAFPDTYSDVRVSPDRKKLILAPIEGMPEEYPLEPYLKPLTPAQPTPQVNP